MRKILFGALGLAAVALAVWYGAGGRPFALVLGTTDGFEPFEFRTAEGVVGLDVDIARAIAAAAGRRLKIEVLEFDQLLPALAAGRVDLVLAGLSITAERRQIADFSVPYYRSTPVALMRKGEPVPDAPEELRGRPIGAEQGTTAARLAAELAGPEEFRPAATAKGAVVDLLNSRVDFALVDRDPALLFEQKNPELQLVDLGFEEEFYGVAVKPGNARLLDTINAALGELVADGRYDELVARWLVQM